MLKIGDKIIVKKSRALSQNGLRMLANKKGVVTALIGSPGRLLGVRADIKVLGEIKNFYIPRSSVETTEQINRIRALGILKSIVL